MQLFDAKAPPGVRTSPSYPDRFTKAEMRAAFDMVKDPDDWRNPIDVIIDDPGKKNLLCVRDAIIYYTACRAYIVKLRDGRVHITAPGYYTTTGGPGPNSH